jgi:hypothetical protein
MGGLATRPDTWQLCRAVKMVNQMLGALSPEKHPDKTFIGKIERGFDFLGYHFSPAGLKVAKKTIANFIEKASRLYEQKRRTVSAVSPLAMYVRRSRQWVRAGFVSFVPTAASLRNENIEEWLVTRLES